MNPEHIELLRRALPHIRDPRVVDVVVGALAQGSDYPVPDIASVGFLDFAALRLCFWFSCSSRERYPSLSHPNAGFVNDHFKNLRAHLNVLEQCASPPP